MILQMVTNALKKTGECAKEWLSVGKFIETG